MFRRLINKLLPPREFKLQPAQPETDIRAALTRQGVDDLQAWTWKNCTIPIVPLSKELNTGAPPIYLKDFLADDARTNKWFDLLARTEAVRELNENFPQGFAASNQQDYGLASAWCSWVGIFEPSHREKAKQVWSRIEDTMRANPQWCPQSPDDPLLTAAFSDVCFAPSEGKIRYEATIAYMHQVTGSHNKPWTYEKALANLKRVAPGYGMLSGLFSIDGQVCNGGFSQFYGNTRGVLVWLGINGFRALNREDYARIVERSILYMSRHYAPYIAKGIPLPQTPEIQHDDTPLDELDTEYFAISHRDDPYWLEIAMTNLIMTKPELFTRAN